MANEFIGRRRYHFVDQAFEAVAFHNAQRVRPSGTAALAGLAFVPAHPVQTGNAEAGGRGSDLPPAGKLDDRAAADIAADTAAVEAVP